MTVLAQLFAATHAEALRRSDALDLGTATVDVPYVDLPTMTPVDLEVLGEVAARSVQFGTGDLEVAEIDLEHDRLFRLPPFLCDVLAELGGAEDPDLAGDVAVEWAASEELDLAGQDLLPVLQSVIDLVTQAQATGLDAYLWVQDA